MLSALYYISSVLFVLYALLDITWRLWKRRWPSLPSFPNVPWLGSIPYFQTDPHENYKKRLFYAKKFNGLHIIWFGPIPIINMARVEYIEPILKSREAITKSSFYNIMIEWLGVGLLISKGTKWKKRRLALTGAFHFSILSDFVEIYEKHAHNLVSKLLDLSSQCKAVEVQWINSLALLDVICETSMGVQINALNSSGSEYVQAVHRIKVLILKRLTSPFTGHKLIYPLTRDGKEYYKCLETLHNFTLNVINENIASRQNSSPATDKKLDDGSSGESYIRQKKVFIDILLDLYENGEIDLEGIREETDTFMFEGHDTTSSSLSWTLYEIGRHCDIQDRLHAEIVEVSAKDCSMLDKIRSLKYMECVIKESLRLHPPVPSYSRMLEKDMVIDNHVIPSGTGMQIDAMNVHRNPTYWDEPTVFKPNRFDMEDTTKRNPYCYIPFSAGSRNCIGQKFAMLEEKVFLYLILLNFRIKSIQTPEEIKTGIELIMSSTNGIYIEFESRN